MAATGENESNISLASSRRSCHEVEAMKQTGLCSALVAFAGILSGCSTPQRCILGGHGDGGPQTKDVGDVGRPHDSGYGNATVRLKVVNTKSDSDRPHFVQWCYKRRGSGGWTIYRDQGRSSPPLVPGTYDVKFRMKYASPHQPPRDEPADLEMTELETLKVRW